STHTAVVVGPHVESVMVRRVQLVNLQPPVVLVIAVLSNGSVEKAVLELDTDADDAIIAAASAVLQRQLPGHRWLALPEITGAGNIAGERLAREARDALAERSRAVVLEPLYVGGASRLAAEQEAFTTSSSAARLLELLEHQVEVVSLVRELLD